MSALFVAGSTRLFKSLVNGDGVDRADISEVASAMFEALLKVQEQGETLARIEAKLDRSLQQDFDRSYRLGVYLLRDASHSELDAAAQDEALKTARTRFLEAAAGTSHRGQRAQALHAAAGCSLLARRPDTARAELDDAWREAFDVLRQTAVRWENPYYTAPQPNFVSEFLFGTATNQKRRAQAEMTAEVEPLRSIVNDIQDMRQALGAPKGECPVLLVPPESWRYFWHPLRFRAKSTDVTFPDGSSVSVKGKPGWTDDGDVPEEGASWEGWFGRIEAELVWTGEGQPLVTVYSAEERDNVWVRPPGKLEYPRDLIYLVDSGKRTGHFIVAFKQVVVVEFYHSWSVHPFLSIAVGRDIVDGSADHRSLSV